MISSDSKISFDVLRPPHCLVEDVYSKLITIYVSNVYPLDDLGNTSVRMNGFQRVFI